MTHESEIEATPDHEKPWIPPEERETPIGNQLHVQMSLKLNEAWQSPPSPEIKNVINRLTNMIRALKGEADNV